MLLPWLFFIISIPQPVSGIQGLPTVKIALTEPSKTAHVGPGDTGKVVFSGMVRVTLNQATRVVVSLDADDTWDSAVVSPESLLFSANGEQPFTVNVTAPPRESFSTIGSVTVTGQWVMYPGGLTGPAKPPDGVDGRINIAQFYDFELISPKTLIETSPGEQVEFKLVVQNNGNGMDVFSIDVQNLNELNNKGFQVTLSQVNMEVLENPAEDIITIVVNVPSSASSLGNNDIKIEVSSVNGASENVPTQTFTFVVRVPNESIVATTEFSFIIVIIVLITVGSIFFWWAKRKGKIKSRNKMKNES